MKDLVTVGALLAAFALLLTVHVAIAFGLVQRSPRWRALVALAVPPLAPYWALREGMKARGTLWIVGLVLYAVAFIVAGRT